MTKTPLWSDDFLRSLLPALDTFPFWVISREGNISIKKGDFLKRFCSAIGIYKLPMDTNSRGKETYTPVFIRDNRIVEVDASIIKNIVTRLLELWDIETGSDFGDDLSTALCLNTKTFSPEGLDILRVKRGIKVLRDTDKSAFVFFQNGWVEVTADAVSPLKTYSDIPEGRFIWESSIIRRDYVTRHSVIQQQHQVVVSDGLDPVTGEKLSRKQRIDLFHKYSKQLEEEEGQPIQTHYHDFLENLSRDDEGEVCKKDLRLIKVALGYLAHRYQRSDQRKWVLVVDRHLDYSGQKANGRNGKGILINSLKPFLSFEEIDGREFTKGNKDKHAFANVGADTDLVYFDDAAEDFDLKRLYAKTTGSFSIRPPYKPPYTIPAADAPKLAITSNYDIADNSSSTQGRNLQVAVSNFYQTKYFDYGLTPTHIHGGKRIAEEDGGWSDSDWSHYFHTILDCISLYLKVGLPTEVEESETRIRSALCASFRVDKREAFLDYLLETLKQAAESGEEVFIQAFYRKTRERFNFPSDVDNEDLYDWLKAVGKKYYLNPNLHKNGSLSLQRLVGDRKKRWVDAGMSDYTDKNGNNPLEKEGGGRVYLFTVASTVNPAAFKSKPDFNKSSDEVTSSPVKQTA